MALRSLAAHASARWGLACAAPAAPVVAASALSFSRAFATVMDGLKYAESHEWVKAEGGVATVGISSFAQSELGDVVYVELPEVGATLAKAEGFGVVESVKAASDVYAPISGEVTEVNEALVDSPGTVNTSPYGEGWLMKVKMSDSSELDALLDADAYKAKIE